MRIINTTQAISLLNEENIVAIPTETVYGLGAKITSEKALNSIFRTKERPFFDPLIVHVSSVEMAKRYTPSWNKICDSLAQAFWPGPLTLIVKKNDLINPLITAGSDFVGLRMPNHELTLKVIEELDVPIAAPSANKFKKTSPTSPLHVFDEFQDDVSILDGGESNVGIESTVAQIFDDKIIIYRPGFVTSEMIKDVLFKSGLKGIEVSYGESPVAPGQLNEHYRPNSPLILMNDKTPPEILIKNLQDNGVERNKISIYKVPSSPEIASRLIYAKMRELSKKNPSAIIFHLPLGIEGKEEWLGILNRLKKASILNLAT